MSLSDRLRPDVEAAPWVIQEVRGLEAEIARLRGVLMSIAVAEGRESYPQELWVALLMDKARGALLNRCE